MNDTRMSAEEQKQWEGQARTAANVKMLEKSGYPAPRPRCVRCGMDWRNGSQPAMHCNRPVSTGAN